MQHEKNSVCHTGAMEWKIPRLEDLESPKATTVDLVRLKNQPSSLQVQLVTSYHRQVFRTLTYISGLEHEFEFVWFCWKRTLRSSRPL